MAVGIWTIVDKSYLENIMRNPLYMSAAYTLTAVGAITIIISFLGCMGSLSVSPILILCQKPSKIILGMYFIQKSELPGYVGEVSSTEHSVEI